MFLVLKANRDFVFLQIKGKVEQEGTSVVKFSDNKDSLIDTKYWFAKPRNVLSLI